MRSVGSVEIDRPIEDVYRVTTEEVAQWSTIVVEEELLEKKLEGVGTTFRTITEEHGKRMEFEGIVTHEDPPRLHAIALTGKMFDLDVEYTFEDLTGRTRVTQDSKVAGKGFFGCFLFLCGWMMTKANCKALAKELDGLKTYCEQTIPVAA